MIAGLCNTPHCAGEGMPQKANCGVSRIMVQFNSNAHSPMVGGANHNHKTERTL